MVLGKLPVPERPTHLDSSRQGPTVLVVGAGGGCLDIFNLVYHFSFLSPSLWETARYRLKYCLKGPLNRPTNRPTTDQTTTTLYTINFLERIFHLPCACRIIVFNRRSSHSYCFT